jgi:hypothetical protein
MLRLPAKTQWLRCRQSPDTLRKTEATKSAMHERFSPSSCRSLSRLSIWRREICFAVRIKAVASARPEFRVRHQPSFHRIHVHVVQLLDAFLSAPYVEIVKANPPETSSRVAWIALPEGQLIRIARSSSLAARRELCTPVRNRDESSRNWTGAWVLLVPAPRNVLQMATLFNIHAGARTALTRTGAWRGFFF